MPGLWAPSPLRSKVYGPNNPAPSGWHSRGHKGASGRVLGVSQGFTMKRLDQGPSLTCLMLCCGDGQTAKVFQDHGYRVIGLDIHPWANWPGDLIVQDIRTFDGTPLCHQVDLLLASPPCTEFAKAMMPWYHDLPDPDLSLVHSVLRIRDEIQPKLFIMENVRGLQRYIGKATIIRHPYYFWGDLILLPRLTLRQKQSYSNARMSPSERSTARGRWPLSLARAIANQLSPLSPGEP